MMKDMPSIAEWLKANIKAVDPLQNIRDWMEANPDNARLYGENNYNY